MIKSMQDNSKKIITYFLCGFLILSVLFMTSGCDDDDLDYSPKLVREYSKKTLAKLYKSFPKETKESKKYVKAKDDNYKSYISTNALKNSDFHTLIAICKKDPTKMNKAYVFACGWNIEYDKTHMSHYAKCLIYYRDRMSKKERKQISTPLHKIMESCIEDPTGEEQREENEDDNRHSTTIIPFPIYMNSDSGSAYRSSSSSSHEGEDEDESENEGKSSESEDEENEGESSEGEDSESESSEESGSESESEPSESESEPTESEPSEPAE